MNIKEIQDITPYLRICYKAEEHLPQFHIAGSGGVEACITAEIKNCLSSSSCKKYLIEDDETFIGYFITDKLNEWNQLSSFFLLPQYRDRKKEFWNIIREKLDNKFILSLDVSNTRAIKFIEKVNGKYYFTLDKSMFFKLGEW